VVILSVDHDIDPPTSSS